MNNAKMERLLMLAMHEGIKLGRELEASKDKEAQLPITIAKTVMWRVQEILNQNKD